VTTFEEFVLEEYSWGTLVAIALMSIVGLWVGITTKPVRTANDPYGLAYTFRWYARVSGYLIGIGGSIIAIRLLIILLRNRL
jgi:uncharacterized membrane protein YfcA